MQNKLIDYLPEFLQEIEELKVIMEIIQPLIDYLQFEIENTYKNIFIVDATCNGIKRYEDMLNIKSKTKESLEDRKFKVLCIYNQKSNYTYKNLINILNNFVGEDNYNIYFSEEFVLNINISLNKKSKFAYIKDLLEEIIPMNITLNLELIFNSWLKLEKFKWGCLENTVWNSIREDLLNEKDREL